MSDGNFTTQMQVNSQHQLWSHWIFGVQADVGRMPLLRDCKKNFSDWCKLGLHSKTGRGRITKPSVLEYVFEVQVEGPPAHDPDFRRHVKRQFIEHFMFKGFGYSARLVRFDVKVLAGDQQDGTPADQLIVIPPIHY